MAGTTYTGAAWPMPKRVTLRVVFLCFLAILFEGYDVGVMGAILPALAADKAWNLTPIELGALGSYALLGMFFGALAIGTLSDMMGRKKMLILCVAGFSLSMAGAAWAPTPWAFGIARFLGGLALGGVIPVAAAYTIEFSPPHRRSLNYGLMYSGYSLGILCSALVAMWLLPKFGWREVVAVGALPIISIPFLIKFLPESLDYLQTKGRQQDALALARQLGLKSLPAAASTEPAQANWRSVLRAIFGPGYLRATVCFWMALFFGMMLVYGLNTWLPQIMRQNGFDLGSSLMFLVVFSLASALGGIFLGSLADRSGPRRIVFLFYLLGGLAILGLMLGNSLLVNYILVALAGIGSISTSLILTGYLTNYYSPHARGTATGWAMSFARLGAVCGPLVGGYIGNLGLAVSWNFIVFSIAGLGAALMVAAIPARPAGE